ncbi:MAG: serine hydrolase domain-containing protein [Vicinamibacteraceae bacterium]
MTRRRFLGMAGVVAGLSGATTTALAAAAQQADMAARFEEASRLIRAQTDSGEVAAAVLYVRHARQEMSGAFGAARVDLPFLLASPTKPMTASAVLWLRDRRELTLDDPVKKYVPAFDGGDRSAVTIRHLLTHTSGLPDMLPENTGLRRRHAPLSEFLARTCRTPLLFPPGRKVSYQSMGILLAAAIVEKISGEPMPGFVARTVFTPMGLRQTSFGLGGRTITETAQCQVPEAERSDWDWNSAYWRNLASPWGGAHATAADLGAFLDAFASPADSALTLATRREMRTVQTGTLRPRFGLGWQREPGAFGRACSPETFGHSGSTGTMAWHDPTTATTFVLLTTRPAATSRASLLVPVSEIIGRTHV